jgi:hypothetical protein
MTDSVKAAVELIKIYHYERETVNGTELLSAVETLITAAEKSDAWENSAKAILVANVIYKDVNEELRARIASLEKDRPEVVTVEEMSKHIQAWKFVDAAPSTFGAYLMKKYPNGLIVQDKEGAHEKI